MKRILSVLATIVVLGIACIGLYYLAGWIGSAAAQVLAPGSAVGTAAAAVAGVLVGVVLTVWWQHDIPAVARRRERQTEVYTFLVDALANVLHLPAPEDLGDATDEVRDVVIDAHATLHAAERQLQLHGGRRVLREYRALRDADETGEVSTELVTNLLVEMRRDLGLSVYSELRETPLGFDLDAAEQAAVEQTLVASPTGGEESPSENGSARTSASSVIASSVHRS